MLVDDHELIRQGIRRAFERTGEFEVVGEAGTMAEARQRLAEDPPRVVVTDVRLPDGSGLDLARELRTAHSDLGIVVLTMYAGDETLFGALDAGASALVAKDAASDDLVSAARHAAISPRSFTTKDLAGAMQRRMEPQGPRLTQRESQILGLLAEGLGVAAIARQLYISESTAKTHISRTYEKLGAANRAQAVMKGVQSGLLPGRE
ncbi:MAG: response regulator transcription factor [Nocardioides sp.]